MSNCRRSELLIFSALASRRRLLPRTQMNNELVRSQGWFAFSKIHTMNGLLSSEYSLRP
jgi:hypothetical protein